MNAGIGSAQNSRFTIEQFIETVRVLALDTGEIQEISREACGFGHRKSIFQNGHYLILGATLEVPVVPREESMQRVAQRMDYIKTHFEYGRGCFGTCFSVSNRRLLWLAAHLRRKCNGISFGKRNTNWLVNDGTGCFADAMAQISLCELIHRMAFAPIRREVVIWE